MYNFLSRLMLYKKQHAKTNVFACCFRQTQKFCQYEETIYFTTNFSTMRLFSF